MTYTNDAFDANDDDSVDDEEEDDPSRTLGIGNVNKRRCARCNHSPLLSYIYEGFNVWYCTQCKQPVCTACLYPALERSNPTPGLVCRKCRKVYTP